MRLLIVNAAFAAGVVRRVDETVVIVDIRDPREIEREGKIPGAFSCTRGMLEFWIDPQSPYAKAVFQQDKKFVFRNVDGTPLWSRTSVPNRRPVG